MLANSDKMLRMYGSGEELQENLKIYMGFSSDGWIGYDPIERYYSFLTEFHSLKDEKFILKSHMFVILHNTLCLNLDIVKYADIYNAVLSIFLKSIDAQNAGKLEFVKRADADKLCKKLVDELGENGIFTKQRHNFPNFEQYSTLQISEAILKIYEKFKTLIFFWKDEYSQLKTIIQNFLVENYPNNVEQLNVAFGVSKFMVTYVEGIISSYPDLFLPYDRKKNPDHPITVRVFQDSDNRFVMKSELLNAINLVNPNSKKYEDINGKLLTLKYEWISNEFGDQIKRIVFLLVPIDRTKHAAVPIQTPSGGHCVLAADALLEILNRLIFCHRIFQKFQESTWTVLSAHLAQLVEFFTTHENSPFFVTIEKVESIEVSIMNSLKIYEKIPTNFVRNAKKDGFTVQNLKNELANLRLTELFPEIQGHAEAVYFEVLKSKKQEFLRTCDLFDAVEKCLLICFFKRLPNLKLFLHTQNACHRLPNLYCNHCSEVPKSQKFKETTWKDFSYDGNSYRYSSPHMETITLPDDQNTSLQPNFLQLKCFSSECRYFLLDMDDHYALSCPEATDEFFEKTVANLETFQKFYPKKKIYIRAIPVEKYRRDETRRVFAEEVLDLIPVVLRQQHTPLKKNDERLNNYRKNWKMPKYSVKTISLTDFWYILEEFDVDKSKITIVPDPQYEDIAYVMMADFEHRYLKIRSPFGNWVVRKEQAAFKIFESAVCEIDNDTNKCPDYANGFELRNAVKAIRQCLEYDEGSYIELKKVEIMNSILRNQNFPKESRNYDLLHRLKMMGKDGFMPMGEFLSEISKLSFDNYNREVMETVPETEIVSLWKFYEWYLNACLKGFQGLEEDLFDIVKVIQEEIPFRIPIDDESSLEKMEPKLCPMGSFFSIKREQNRKDDVDRKIKKKKTPKKKADVDMAPESPDDTQKTLVPEEASPEIGINSSNLGTSEICDEEVSEEGPEVETSTSDDIQQTSPIKKLPVVEINQSKNCTKCLRTSEMCNEAKKELKLTQNRLEKYEKKAKRTEEVEIQMREMELEMKRMKKEIKERELEVKKKDTENEDLKRSVLQLEAKNAKMQLAEKNHSISQNDLLEKITNLSDQLKIGKDRDEMIHSERIDELTAQLEDRNEKIQLMELHLQNSEENLKLEVREKERGFEELRAVLSIMSNEMESIQRDNRNLRERIASIPEAPPPPTVPDHFSEGQPNHPIYSLRRFQRIKDSFDQKKQLKQAKEMVEKMKSCTDLVEIYHIADYEYYQFEANLLKYVKEVELNIQRIKEACDVSTVTPLPDIPEFSKRLMNLYWRIINKQPITPSEIEVSDSECFICTEEMASDQKTLQCQECKKVTHHKCASKWLKINRWCPHCREKMLDPEEFPNLGQ
ncbi:hypothetical protein B9Z55_009206 [Caenorhabditis nigoni]|uniref:RING-type domain-containing protein n=2 Tax=Caenorhabditis nigoni TaxID=1611254 RepID=A0A2G5UR37_9PELO|nr:hypothetical protein B9Z55_009206 [Caenorhabditis nigoni]